MSVHTDAIISRMSLEQKIAQVMAVGFDGVEAPPELLDWVARGLGGVVFFARNIESPRQVANLCNQLQSAALASGSPGLMLAVDQEGGRVARLTEDHGFTEFPSAMALGATGDPENARLAARAIAREMKAAGLNADFAPVLDVNNNAANPVIGTRSFSDDPQVVADFGCAFTAGLQQEGVLAFGKHFPGHGDTAQDSHFTLPVVPHSLERLEAVEFVPFRAAVRAGVGAIMSTHINFPAVEPGGLPGTLSPRVMTGLIRGDFGFTGLLATDSLEMGALGAAGFPAPKAAAAALAAGADLLLFNHDDEMHRKALAEVTALVRDGRITVTRLENAARRVLEAKARFGMLDPLLADPDEAVRVCASPDHRRLSRALAAQALQQRQRGQAALPLRSALVIEIPGAEGLAARMGFSALPAPADPDRAAVQAIVTAVGSWAAAHHSSASPAALVVPLLDAAARHPGQRALLDALQRLGLPLVAAALRGPADLAELPGDVTSLAVYGSNPPALDALASYLMGR